MKRTKRGRTSRGFLACFAFATLVWVAPLPLAGADDETPTNPTLQSCGGEQGTEERPWGRIFFSRNYKTQTFTPREKPAMQLSASELEMMQKGYVDIGWIEVTRFTVFEALNKTGDGMPIQGPDNSFAVAFEEAARRGGDVFTQFGQEEPIYQTLQVPNPQGLPAGACRGMVVKGWVWRRAPEKSREQLLVYAAQYGKLGVVQRLLSSRPSVNIDAREPRFCYTSLIAAAQFGASAVVRELIAAGAKLELKDSYGRTALDYAAFPRHSEPKACESARLLRQAGAREPKGPSGHFSFDFPAPRRCPAN